MLIVMSYFVECPKYLHKHQFALREVIYFGLIMINFATRLQIFITKINIKMVKNVSAALNLLQPRN